MAKKKKAVRPKKRKKQASPFFSTVKRMFAWAFFVVVCLIGVLYLYSDLYPDAGNKPETKEKKESTEVVETNKKKSSIPKTSTQTKTLKIPADAEIPKLQVKRDEQVIRHDGYTVSYNSDYKIANWVAYELTAEEAKSKKTERSNKFSPDPQIKGATATNEDYTRTGYDRGHLAPAGDMKWSAKAMRESFYFSNICPQKPGLNRGIWKELEEQSRMWAMDNRHLLIVTGPVITDDMKRMGKNRVGVPDVFYKVICFVSGNKYKGIAFLLDNKDYGNVSLKSVAIPVDSVEKVTGIDFFPALPDELENEMEASVDWSSWSF